MSRGFGAFCEYVRAASVKYEYEGYDCVDVELATAACTLEE